MTLTVTQKRNFNTMPVKKNDNIVMKQIEK